MARGSANRALRQIRTLYGLGAVGGLTDADLVERFLGRDGPDREDAFAALVRRHGPMVLGVCRRMLGGSADAEDAFQAVFLVLARKAGAVRGVEGLRSWLYGVAVRTAKEARRRSARRRAREGGALNVSRALAATAEGRGDLLDLLDEELDRLPGRYRDPLLLCELEGVSRRDAARRLGLAEGTLSSRLARGRSLLRGRLARRGVALGTGLLGAILPEPAGAALPEPLADAAVRLALRSAAGGAVPADLLARALGRAASPWARTIPTAALATGVLAAAVVGWAIAARRMNPVGPVPVRPPAPDDPLPEGATLRFGTPRFRHPTTIEGLAVLPGGRVAVASSGTLLHGAVRSYDLTTGLVRSAFDGAIDVEAVAASPDGQTLATTTVRNHTVYLYDTTSGLETGRVDYPGANPSTTTGVLAFSPDGRRIVVSAATGKALHLIDLAGREVIRTLRHADIVFASAFSPDGKQVAGGGYDVEDGVYFARLWEADTGKEVRRFRFGRWGIRSLAFSGDGSTLAIGGDYGRPLALKLFDAATGTERLTIPFPDATSIRSVAFSPDGGTIAAAGGSSTRLFDTADGRERTKIDRKAIGLRFSTDGTTLVGAVAGAIYRWDAATGRSLIPEGGNSPVAQIEATPDGRDLVTLGQDGDGHVWDAQTGEHRRRLNMGWRRGFALSPDGRFLVWPEAVESIQFPDADRPGATRAGTRLRMFDLAAGTPVDRFGGFEGDAHDLWFTDGGKTLVTVERYRRDAGVRLWDLATGRVARSIPTANEPGTLVWSSRLSPDRKVLAITSRKYPSRGLGEVLPQSVTLWDLASGKGLDGPPPHWSDAEVLTFGPDGKTVAVATPEGTIQSRDVATGRVRGAFLGPRDRVTSLAFGPDGRLFTGAPDGTVLAWPPPPADPK